MSSSPRRLGSRQAVVAASFALLVALSACSSAAVAKPYTPGIGAVADVGSAQLRALTVVANQQGHGRLTGTVLTTTADQLTGISGVATGADFQELGAVTVTSLTAATGPNAPLNLTTKNLAVSGTQLKPGFYAKLTFTFAQAGKVTVMVPIVDSTQPDYASAQPSA